MVPFTGYGYDARFANSFIGYGDDARIVNRLSVSCFCLAVTITETGPPASPERSRWRAGFVTLTVTEIMKKYASAARTWPSSAKISLVNYYKEIKNRRYYGDQGNYVRGIRC